MEYCSLVWSPYTISDTRKLEQVQRKFTKRLKDLENLTYSQRLLKLRSETLELRRLKTDLKMYYYTKHFSEDIKDFSLRCGRPTRGHSLTIRKGKIRNNLERYGFRNRCIDIWNKLPQNVVNAPNMDSFKRSLEKIPSSFYSRVLVIR